MTQPEQSTKVNEDNEGNKSVKLRNYDDEVTSNDLVVKENENNELRRRREQEIIQKAIAFWNHPALRDVPTIEKLSYLHQKQGLTNSQIHEVWEGMDGVDYSYNKCLDSNTTGELNVTAPEPYSRRRHHNHHHRYRNRQQSSDLPTSTTDGQDFNSNEAPYTQPFSSKYNYDYKNHVVSDQQQLYPALLADNRLAKKEGDESISVVRGLSILGVGGFLGVTGAAAMRWINGGRFELLPPPATNRMNSLNSSSTSSIENASSKRQTQGQTSTLGQQTDKLGRGHQMVREHVDERTVCNIDHENNIEYDEEDEYDDVEYSEINQIFGMEGCLMQRMDDLLSSIDSNSALQERLVLKLANTSTITDDSMSLLKQTTGSERNNNKQSHSTGSSGSNSFLLTQLKEVKGDLASLCKSMMNKFSSKSGTVNANEGWREEWSELLHKVETCIAIIENPNNRFPVELADTKSMSTSETTATENQAQDIQSSTVTPSTPATDTSDKNQLHSPFMPPTSIPLSLRDCIIKIAEKNDIASLISGSQLLYLYLSNLSGNPDNRRYRKIYTSNESFQKVKNLKGGEDLLRTVGFEEKFDEGIFEWVPTRSTDKEISALILVKEATASLGILKKPDNIPSPELVQTALSNLSSSSAFCFPNQSPLPSERLENKENGNGGDNHNPSYHNQDGIPQTPSGSALLSPPMPKKMPFIPTPSDVSMSNGY